MLASPLPPSFLGTYCLSTSSLRCKALWIVMSFLVLWSIFGVLLWSTLRMVPSISRAQVFIPLIRFIIISTPVLTGSSSLRSKRQQVFSCLQDSSKYFNWVVLILPLVSSFPSLFFKHFGSVPRILLLLLLLFLFSHLCLLVIFQCRLSDSKSPQVSRTLLSILADFNHARV